MRARLLVGGAAGLAAALLWSVGLAIYQPLMQPHGSWTDPTTGDVYPNIGSNNTYWPRDLRQLAILLAFAAVILIGGASRRAIAIGAIGTGVWVAADLALDRFDVGGSVAFAVLAVLGAGWFAATAFVAVRTPSPPGPQVYRVVAATATALLAPAAMLVTTPFTEPVFEPDKVRVENALAALQIGLAVAALAVAVGIAGLTVRSAVFLAVAGIAGALAALYPYLAVGSFGTLALAVAAVLAVSSAPPGRLAMLGVTVAGALFPFTLAMVIFGSIIGTFMTWLAGNPPINSADTDLSLSVAAAVLGVVFGLVAYAFVRPAAPLHPADSAADVAYN